MLFHEGWAELHSPAKPEAHWPECWQAQQEGRLPSLRDLTGPDYYHNSIGPMYTLGSVVVEYILKRFGHEKFLELCCTCREATFPADVERVLGVSLDQLDRDYQQDLAQRQLPAKERLLSAKLADGIDPVQWRYFVNDYFAGTERFRAAFRQSSVKASWTFDNKDDSGHVTKIQNRYEYYYDEKRYAYVGRYSAYSVVDVRTPKLGFGFEEKTRRAIVAVGRLLGPESP